MEWTTPVDINNQLERLWTKGRILAARMGSEPLFPLVFPDRGLPFRKPDRSALSERFEEVRHWIRSLEDGSRDKRGFGYDIEWIETNHRVLGRNRVPDRIAIRSEQDALRLIKKDKHAARFDKLAGLIIGRFPVLAPWITRKPLSVLDHGDDWHRILAVLAWFCEHPQSGLYLRQLDIEGIDTKFIETRRGILSELLEVVLPQGPDRNQPEGAQRFEHRFGLRTKPVLIRFRLLDARLALHGLTDLSVPAVEFARLAVPVQRVFITENEVNGLAFPDVAGSMVIFGLGYGLELLSNAHWLGDRAIYYWGDIDTHGFAMLDRLRLSFPGAHSLLMDRETLLAHRALCVEETSSHEGPLARLTDAERSLFDDLRLGRHGERLRLEQERIAFGWLRQVLDSIVGDGTQTHR